MSALADERLLDLSLIKFLVVGLANTLSGLSVIYLAKWLLEFGDVSANVVGYTVGISLSFALNKRWTFRHEGAYLTSLIRFLIVIGVAYLANLATVLTAIEVLRMNSYLAQALGIVPYTALTYLGSRYFAFNRPARFTQSRDTR